MEKDMAVDEIDSSRAPGKGSYRAINPIDLPRIERDVILGGEGDGIYVEGVDVQREFHRYGATFVDDPDGVGLFSGKIGPDRYLYPPVFTAAVSHATLVGYRTILTT